jgi:protein involved in polysaccharide export with SLBB domain
MSATKMESSRKKIFPTALIAALCTLGIAACSTASHDRGDQPGRNDSQQTASLNPELCMQNGAGFEPASFDGGGYHIQPGDQLAVDFYLNSEFNDNVSVQPDGRIVLRLVGPLQASGLTPAQLSSAINQAYAKELKNPSATVHVQNMPSRQIFVQGQVNHPGGFPLQPGMTALQAIASAGGHTDEAAMENVVLIRRDACGKADGSKLDLASATDTPDKGEDVMLMPRDTLVVPRSKIANVDLFVKQYIRDLLPVQPYLSPPIP